MSTITSLVGTDGITTANSMTKINTNFANLNTDKIETSVLDTDTSLAANSDSKVATQKATKAYVDAIAPTLRFAGVRAYQNATTSLTSTYAALAFQVENFDTDAYHDNASNNSRLTVPSGKAGYYSIGGNMKITTTSGKAIYGKILLNGSTLLAGNLSSTGVDSLNTVSVTTLYYLNVGDYVEFYGAAASADTSTGDLNTNFWMYRVGT
jgi:hypothetical protein